MKVVLAEEKRREHVTLCSLAIYGTRLVMFDLGEKDRREWLEETDAEDTKEKRKKRWEGV